MSEMNPDNRTRDDKSPEDPAAENPVNNKERTKKIRNIMLMALSVVLLSGGIGYFAFFSSPVKTSDKKPYSILVDRYESNDEAVQSVKRLRKMNVKAYIVKKLSEGDDFSIDVHAGAFKTNAEAEDLLKDLEKKGIKNAKIVNFGQMKQEISQFEQLPVSEKKEFALSKAEIPDLPDSIINTLAFFPVDNNFKVVSLKIADFTKKSDVLEITPFQFDQKILPDMANPLFDRSKAISQAVYADKLLGYRVGVTVFSVESPEESGEALQIAAAEELGAAQINELDYRTSDRILSGALYSVDNNNDKTFIYVASLPESGQILFMVSDCPEDVFINLVKKGGSKEGLLYFPEVRKNLYVLPKNIDEDKLGFLFYYFDVVGPEYAEMRSNADWAQSIVGNYLSNCWFLQEDGDYYSISFFNLNYAAAATGVHEVFMDEKTSTDYGIPTDIHDGKGWYIDEIIDNELSFSNGSYIVALNIFANYDSGEYLDIILNSSDEEIEKMKEGRLAVMKNYSDKLQIWNSSKVAVKSE